MVAVEEYSHPSFYLPSSQQTKQKDLDIWFRPKAPPIKQNKHKTEKRETKKQKFREKQKTKTKQNQKFMEMN